MSENFVTVWVFRPIIWPRALKDGKSVYADIDLNYEGNSFRPTSFDITYYIDGEYTMLRIYNE